MPRRSPLALLVPALLLAGRSASPIPPLSPLSGVQRGAALPAFPAGTLLWIGAHPDDEVLASPLLGQLCLGGGRACVLLVATRGENGICRLSGGCLPDLGTVRSAEMRRAAALYQARLIQGSLPDLFGPSPAGVRQGWADSVGGDDELRAKLRGVIEQVAPAAILTFDPRHGSTCHDAHRAIARLTVQVLRQMGAGAPPVFLLEDRVEIAPGGTAITFTKAVPDDPAALRFSALRSAPDGSGTAWDFLLENAREHRSQLDATFLASLAAEPAEARQIFVLPGSAYQFDPRYLALCP